MHVHTIQICQRNSKHAHMAHKSTVAKLSPTGRHISHLPMKTHFVVANHLWFYWERAQHADEKHQSHKDYLFTCEFFNICLIGLNRPIYNARSMFLASVTPNIAQSHLHLEVTSSIWPLNFTTEWDKENLPPRPTEERLGRAHIALERTHRHKQMWCHGSLSPGLFRHRLTLRWWWR